MSARSVVALRGQRRARSHRHERGAAAVEFALISMFIFILLFGILQYGFYFWQRQGASGAAKEAARAASVGKWACGSSDDQLTYEVADLIPIGTNAEAIAAKGLVASRDYSGGSVEAAEVGDTVKVTVSFDGHDLGLVPLPSNGDISTSASARVENVTAQSVEC